MKALYRKYRPLKLTDVIGQETVTDALSAQLKKGQISHAYLFTGPRGCGKTSVARIFAHEINGFPYETEDFYPDIIEIDAASNTGVDNIREIRERAIVAPTEGKYKVYIIDEVHMLSKPAFNALLKTLEEPPAHVVFIMATTDAYKVPITITSRAQVFEFKLARPDVMLKHLESIAKQENVKITADALEVIVQRGGGSFRDSISLLDQLSTLKDSEITKEDVETALGLPDTAKIEALVTAYRSGSLTSVSESLKDLLGSGVKAEIIAEEIIDFILAHPEPGLIPLLSTLTEVQYPFPEAKLLLAFTAEQKSKSFADNEEISPRGITTPTEPNPRKTRGEVPTGRCDSEGRATESPAEPEISPSARDFDSAPGAGNEPTWPEFVEAVKAKNPSLADILTKATSKIEGFTITIIPEKKIYKSILTSPNNATVLKSCLPEGCALSVADPGESVISANDPQISKLSAIMGGSVKEVQADGGNIPFE